MKTMLRAIPVVLAVCVALSTPGAGHQTALAARSAARSASTILSVSGNGITNTRRFHVPGTWRIMYRFSHCSVPGFSIYVKGGPNDIASDERGSGTGVQYEYGSGNVYLTLNTACSWHVSVYSGRWVVNGPGLRISGNGITNTIAFRVPSEWQIRYSFWNCSVPGFSIYVQGGDNDIMSRDGNRGTGVQYEHTGGTLSLTINTACFWQVGITR